MQLGKMHQRFTYKQAVPPWRTAPPMKSARQQMQRSRRSWVCRAQPGLLNLPLDRDLELPISGFDSIKDALTELAAGKFLVVIDDEDRENEGDLIIAADKVTPEAIAYMVEYTSGVVCIGMEGKDLDRLRLPLMVSSAENEEAMYTAFTVTVDLRDGITTGISAADRAATLQRLANPSASAAEFRRPGHIFPLRSRAGGVIVRPGHTEASVDLARLAGCFPAGALCEVVDKADGSMARTPQLLALAKAHGLKCVTIADLIRYRLRHDQLVQLTGSFSAQCRHGPVVVHSFQCCLDGSEHVLVMAARTAADAAAGSLQHPTPVHVHNASLVSDCMGLSHITHISAASHPSDHHGGSPGNGSSSNGGSPIQGLTSLAELHAFNGGTSSSSSSQDSHHNDRQRPPLLPLPLDAALAAICQQGQGAVVLMRPHLDSKPGLAAELRGQAMAGRANVCAGGLDLRSYGLAAQMLRCVGVGTVAVLGEDPAAAVALRSCGLAVQPAAPGSEGINGTSTGSEVLTEGVVQASAVVGAGR